MLVMSVDHRKICALDHLEVNLQNHVLELGNCYISVKILT